MRAHYEQLTYHDVNRSADSTFHLRRVRGNNNIEFQYRDGFQYMSREALQRLRDMLDEALEDWPVVEVKHGC